MTYTPPDPSTYTIPSAASRAVRAVIWLVPSVLLYVVIPLVGLNYLAQLGLKTGYSLTFIAIAGIILAALGAARSFYRPTAAYGPLSIAQSLGTVVYLLVLAHGSTLSVSFNSATLTLEYAGLILAFALVPVIRAGSGVVTTIEDLARPKERLPFDYPAHR